MNELRQLMLEELHRRNFAATTIRTYLHGVEHFSRYFRRPPDQLGPEDIRKYQAMLFTKLKFSPNTVILRLASLRFFYIHVLKRNWSIAETPYPKKLRHLPGVLSQEEVTRLIDAADTPFHRILLMTMYATGARRAEAARLKVSDIDSKRMVVHIREGIHAHSLHGCGFCSATTGSSIPSNPSADLNMCCDISAPTPIASPSPTPDWSPSPMATSLFAGVIPLMATRSGS